MNGLFLSEILSKWDYINYILYYKVLEQYFSNIENKNKLNDISKKMLSISSFWNIISTKCKINNKEDIKTLIKYIEDLEQLFKLCYNNSFTKNLKPIDPNTKKEIASDFAISNDYCIDAVKFIDTTIKQKINVKLSKEDEKTLKNIETKLIENLEIIKSKDIDDNEKVEETKGYIELIDDELREIIPGYDKSKLIFGTAAIVGGVFNLATQFGFL